MISSIKAIETGKLTQLLYFKYPYQYGYTVPKTRHPSTLPITDQATITRISSNRAKHQVRRLIIGNIYHYPQYKPVFLTLTYKENMQDLKRANMDFRLFIKRLDYQTGQKLRYIAVPEFQERGAIHYHILLFNLPYLKGELIESIWKHGKTDIRLAYRGKGIFNYMTKYLTKSYGDTRYKHSKRYFQCVDNHPKITRNEAEASFIALGIEAQELIMQYEYDIVDVANRIVNHVKNMEYLNT
jgi:hypothetical protein